MIEHFKHVLDEILSKILIKPDDSEITKANKLIWYSIIGSTIGLFIITWLIFVILTFTYDNVKVPMIVGDDIYVALNKLSERRLVASVSTQYNDKYEPGIVFRQNPSQGSIVKKGRPVSFFVSLGSRDSSLPDFRGLTLFELEKFLDDKYPGMKISYKIDTPVYQFNEEVEKGRIFKQEPKDGFPIYKVKKVKFWISNGLKDREAKTLENFVGKNIEDVSDKLANLEIAYNYEFEPVNDKSKDLIIIDQSIGEGKIINELIEEGKILTLKVNKYQEINGEKITGTYLLDLPKKPLPFILEVKIKEGISNEKTILKRKIKGGVSIPVLYTAKKNSVLLIYIDGKIEKRADLKLEEESNQ